MSGERLGELAALGAAFVWCFSSIFFTLGGRRVGSLVVNRTRLALAVFLVGAMHWLLYGRPFPQDLNGYRAAWLAASAIVGLALGDTLLFQSYVLLGTRLGVLLLSLAPVFSATFAWLFLGERLTATEVGGGAIALAGVAWVTLEKNRTAGSGALAVGVPDRRFLLGLLCGLGSAACQAGNLVLAKPALAGGFPSLSATMVRMTTGALVMWVFSLFGGQAAATLQSLRKDHGALLFILGGAFVGPFLGVWLSMTAIQSASVGIASTLMALTPVLALPVVHRVFHDTVTPRALLGTLVTMAGVAVIFLF